MKIHKLFAGIMALTLVASMQSAELPDLVNSAAAAAQEGVTPVVMTDIVAPVLTGTIVTEALKEATPVAKVVAQEVAKTGATVVVVEGAKQAGKLGLKEKAGLLLTKAGNSVQAAGNFLWNLIPGKAQALCVNGVAFAKEHKYVIAAMVAAAVAYRAYRWYRKPAGCKEPPVYEPSEIWEPCAFKTRERIEVEGWPFYAPHLERPTGSVCKRAAYLQQDITGKRTYFEGGEVDTTEGKLPLCRNCYEHYSKQKLSSANKTPKVIAAKEKDAAAIKAAKERAAAFQKAQQLDKNCAPGCKKDHSG